jgi:hypothetical protein
MQLQQLGLRAEPGLVAAEKNEACVIDASITHFIISRR